MKTHKVSKSPWTKWPPFSPRGLLHCWRLGTCCSALALFLTLPQAASAGCSCKMASPVSTPPQSIQMDDLHLGTLPGLPNQNMPHSRKITFLFMTSSLHIKARCWTRKAFGPPSLSYFILEVQNYHG